MDRRFTRADAAAWAVVGVLAAATILPLIAAEGRANELAHRATCADQLRKIARAFNVYAAQNADLYPYLPPATDTTYDPSVKGELSTAKTAAGAIAEMYKGDAYANNPCASLWILVLNGQLQSNVFICPSDPFANAPTPPQKDAAFRMNFDSPKALSYSVAYMWGAQDKKGLIRPAPQWLNTGDSSLPVASDIAPYLSSKVDADEIPTRGTVSSATAPAPASAPAPTRTDALVLPDHAAITNPEKYNSPNHLFDGQNVAFADAHVEFDRRPDIGQSNENIWTQSDFTHMTRTGPTEHTIDAGQLPLVPSPAPPPLTPS